MTDRVLIVTARYPVLGEVKSRLAADIGQEAALSVYRRLLDRCAAVVSEAGVETFLFFTGTDDPATRERFSSMGCRIESQCEGDIGVRMQHAFESVWQLYPGAKLVLMGTDVPDASARIIHRAFEALDRNDAVIGPAADGGYYLVGLRSPEPAIFSGIAWSTETVRAQTLEVLHSKGKRVALVDELHDIDYLADLHASNHFPEYPSKQ